MDDAHFEDFYRKTAGALWTYLFRLCGDAATADDLLQKAFLKLLRTNPNVPSDDDLRNWLFRVATNTAFDHFRRSKRDRMRLSDFRDDRVVPPRPDLDHDVARAFGELTQRERAMLWLAHVERAGHDEIGDALGVKSASVKVLLFRARKRLRALLSKRGLAP